jgi:hypothetical protein
MLNWIKKQLRDILTEPDNKTICPVRVIGILGSLQGLGMSAYDVVIQHQHFDLQAFGLGMGATVAALGVALGIKKDTQP